MSNALEVLKRIVREEYKNIKDGVNIHPDGFRDYAPEENSDFDEPHSTEKMESVKEELLSENPAASAAAAMVMMQMQNPDTGKRVKAITPLKNKDHKLHNKAKDIFKRLKDKFSNKKEPQGTVHNYLPKDYKRESVNEARSTNREWNKFEKAFGDFFTTVLRLGKANTKLTGNKTDEKIMIKNFNRDVGKFYSLMQSWVRGQSESVNEGNFDRGTSGLPKGFTDDYYKIVKKLSKGKGYLTLSKSDKKKVWATLGKIYTESINEAVKDPKLKVGQKIRHKSDPRRLYKLKKITHGNSGIPEDPAGTSYMFVAPGNRKEYHTKKTWAQAIKKGWIIPESVNEKISKEEWAEYPKWARKLKPYMKRLLKIPVKVRVIKQANHNPWIEVRVARFGKDVIPNDFRKRALKAIGGGRPRDMDNIHYGNITTGSVSLKHDQWVKMLGNKVR